MQEFPQDEPIQQIPASQFKARCLALLDEVAATGQARVVTKRGKPVAMLVSLGEQGPADLRGSVRYEREEDLISPLDEVWEADR